jgi:hypothetical protein
MRSRSERLASSVTRDLTEASRFLRMIARFGAKMPARDSSVRTSRYICMDMTDGKAAATLRALL